MMSVENGFNIPVSSCFVNINANGNQVQLLPATSEVLTKETKITISQSFINRVKKYL
jgi:hypothetical protein